MNLNKLFTKLAGGVGSGNWAHVGRPGKRGGSAPGGGLSKLGLDTSSSREDRVKATSDLKNKFSVNFVGKGKDEYSRGLGIEVDKIISAADDTYTENGLPKNCDTSGYCQILAIRTWDRLGQPESLRPYDVLIDNEENYEIPHTILFDKSKNIVVDVAGDQFSPDGASISIGSKDKYPYSDYLETTSTEMEELRDIFGVA